MVTTNQLTPAEAGRPRAPVAHFQVVVVGGGSAGLAVAARLRRAPERFQVAVVEPRENHDYQPLWTLVGGGVVPKSAARRPEASLIPPGVRWIRSRVVAFAPEENRVVTDRDEVISYDFLVVAPGIEILWEAVAGLAPALGRDGVSSNWSYEHVDRTWEFIRSFRGGTALFTFPASPVKCPGAAQKIMYLADEHFRRSGVRAGSEVIFASAADRIFAVDKYAYALEQVVERKGIKTRFRHNLVELRPDRKEAVFEQLDTGERAVIPYDLLHVTPPQGAPRMLKESALANEAGWADVHRDTLQHARFPNVFSLGDASSLPTSKTGAAIRRQAPVLVANLRAALHDRPPVAAYDGYTACPLVTGYDRLILAEFDYELRPRETFPFDQAKERYSMYLLKRHLLPALYWHGILRGLA